MLILCTVVLTNLFLHSSGNTGYEEFTGRCKVGLIFEKMWIGVAWGLQKLGIILLKLKSRPCGFGQSLGGPIVQSFSHFFWSPKKTIVQSQGIFGQSLRIFGRPNFFQAYQNFFWSTKFFFWLTKNSQRLTKNSLRLDNLFLVDQKKREKDRTLGRPRDWPKPHGRDFSFPNKNCNYGIMYAYSHFFYFSLPQSVDKSVKPVCMAMYFRVRNKIKIAYVHYFLDFFQVWHIVLVISQNHCSKKFVWLLCPIIIFWPKNLKGKN